MMPLLRVVSSILGLAALLALALPAVGGAVSVSLATVEECAATPANAQIEKDLALCLEHCAGEVNCEGHCRQLARHRQDVERQRTAQTNASAPGRPLSELNLQECQRECGANADCRAYCQQLEQHRRDVEHQQKQKALGGGQ